jgi:hypothetical protein
MPTELPLPKRPRQEVRLRKLFSPLMRAKLSRWKRKLLRIIRRKAGR